VLGAIRRNGVASDARLSQQVLLDFACWRSGQSLKEVDLAWYLEFGQPTDQILANIIRIQNMTDLRYDRSDHRLTPIAVRDTIDGNLRDRRVPERTSSISFE
jgi:hypothetical protein